MDSLTIFLAVIAALLVIAILLTIIKLNNYKSKFEIDLLKMDGLLKEKNLEVEKMSTELNSLARNIAAEQFEKWKVEELDSYKKRVDVAAEYASKLMLEKWKIDHEAVIRKDAANRSVRNVMGKVAEQLIPFSDAFKEWNPKDARFIGGPIDIIVFDGVEDKKDKITIFFIEVKTGTSGLSPKQKKIMEAVKDKRVEWRRLNISDFGDEVNSLL